MKNMKCIISLLMVAAMCLFLFAGCKKDKDDELLILDETHRKATEAPTVPETKAVPLPTVPETEPEPTVKETEPEVIETEPIETEPAIDDRYDNISGDTSKYTEVDQTVYAINDVNIRSGPGVDYDKIGLLKYGSAVQRIAYNNNGWSKVIYNNQIVYIASEYLSMKKPTVAVDPYAPTEDTKDEDTDQKTEEKDDSQTSSGGSTDSSGDTGNTGSNGDSITGGSGNGDSNHTGIGTGTGSGSTHDHAYSTIVYEPTCKEKGYTSYRCSCGYSYTADVTPATGVCVYNSWALTVPPTYDQEGMETRTCCMCGGKETRSVPKLEREENGEDEIESISTSSLAAHGNSYAATLGFIVDTSMNSGNSSYYPALDYDIDTMDQGYSAVESSVKATFDRLEATGESPVGVCRVNVDVYYGYDHPTRGAIYYVRVYYG